MHSYDIMWTGKRKSQCRKSPLFPRREVTAGCRCTIFVVWLAQLEVLTGTSWAVLSAQREAHRLDLLPQGVQGAEDLFHALASRQEVVAGRVGGDLAAVDGALGLLGDLDGQGLDDFPRGTLGAEKNQQVTNATFTHSRGIPTCSLAKCEISGIGCVQNKGCVWTNCWRLGVFHNTKSAKIILVRLARPVLLTCLPRTNLGYN